MIIYGQIAIAPNFRGHLKDVSNVVGQSCFVSENHFQDWFKVVLLSYREPRTILSAVNLEGQRR